MVTVSAKHFTRIDLNRTGLVEPARGTCILAYPNQKVAGNGIEMLRCLIRTVIASFRRRAIIGQAKLRSDPNPLGRYDPPVLNAPAGLPAQLFLTI